MAKSRPADALARRRVSQTIPSKKGGGLQGGKAIT